jgi:anti-sigma B factor antagonist
VQGFGLTIEELGGGAVRIGLRGELDLAHAYTFDEELRRVEEARPPCVVLDLRELNFLDSCGLARLLAARRRARKAGHRLLLVKGPPAIQRLFALSAVDEAFEMVSELPGALSRA